MKDRLQNKKIEELHVGREVLKARMSLNATLSISQILFDMATLD